MRFGMLGQPSLHDFSRVLFELPKSISGQIPTFDGIGDVLGFVFISF
jgi:hypothetical protein